MIYITFCTLSGAAVGYLACYNRYVGEPRRKAKREAMRP